MEAENPADHDTEEEDSEPDEEIKHGEKDEKDEDLTELTGTEFAHEEMGTTEYCLIGLWAVFTAGIFALLYRITQEADEEHEQNKR